MDLDILNAMNDVELEKVRAAATVNVAPLMAEVFKHYQGVREIHIQRIHNRRSNRYVENI